MDDIEALYVAARVARYRRAVTQARLKSSRHLYFSKSDYEATQAKLRAIPVEDRPAFLRSFEASDILDDVEFARLEMAGLGTSPYKAPRVVQFAAKRPYGLNDRIIRKVAKWAERRFGKPVTPRAVERAWKLLRSIEHTED